MIAAQPLDLYGSEAVFFVVSQAAQAGGGQRWGT